MFYLSFIPAASAHSQVGKSMVPTDGDPLSSQVSFSLPSFASGEHREERAQKTEESRTQRQELMQLTNELAQKTDELAYKTNEHEQEQRRRKAAEELLLQCDAQPSSSNGGKVGDASSGGAVSTVELLPIHYSNNKNSGGEIDDGERSVGGAPMPSPKAISTLDITVDSHFSLTPKKGLRRDSFRRTLSVVRRMSTTTVSSRTEFTNALTSNVVIEFTANILLTNQVSINGLTGVIIDGKGFELDGNNAVKCLSIKSGAEVTLTDLTITRGSAPYGGGLEIDTGTITMTSCIFQSNAATYGAGVCIWGSAIVTITSCIFQLNTAVRIRQRSLTNKDAPLNTSSLSASSPSSVVSLLSHTPPPLPFDLRSLSSLRSPGFNSRGLPSQYYTGGGLEIRGYNGKPIVTMTSCIISSNNAVNVRTLQ